VNCRRLLDELRLPRRGQAAGAGDGLEGRHCLNDLIFRWRAGTLGGDIAPVVTNREDLRPMAEAAGLRFVHIPMTPATKPQAEARLLELVDQHKIDLVVLARYMQMAVPQMHTTRSNEAAKPSRSSVLRGRRCTRSRSRRALAANEIILGDNVTNTIRPPM
jgi:hypothetical protein